jgi:hypothetical protein
MKYINLSESFETVIYKLKDINRREEAFGEFLDVYEKTLKEFNISSADFRRDFLKGKEARRFTLCVDQLRQWKNNINLDKLNDIVYAKQIIQDINIASINAMDLLSRLDIERGNFMEDEIYQTGELTYPQMKNFCDYADKEIGTEHEVDEIDNNKYTVSVFELNQKEVQKLRDFENNSIDEVQDKYCMVFKLKGIDQIYRSKWFDDYEDAEDEHGYISSKFGTGIFEFRYVDSILDPYSKLDDSIPLAQAIEYKSRLNIDNYIKSASLFAKNLNNGVINIPDLEDLDSFSMVQVKQYCYVELDKPILEDAKLVSTYMKAKLEDKYLLNEESMCFKDSTLDEVENRDAEERMQNKVRRQR